MANNEKESEWTFLADPTEINQSAELIKKSFTIHEIITNMLGVSFYILFYQIFRIPIYSLAYLILGIENTDKVDILYWLYFLSFLAIALFLLSLISKTIRQATLSFFSSFISFAGLMSRIIWITVGLSFAMLFMDLIQYIAYYFMGRGFLYDLQFWKLELTTTGLMVGIVFIIYLILRSIIYVNNK